MQWFSKVALPLPPQPPTVFQKFGVGEGVPEQINTHQIHFPHSPSGTCTIKFHSLLILSPCYYSDSYIPCTKLNTIHVLEFKCTKKGFFTGLHNFPYILFIY